MYNTWNKERDRSLPLNLATMAATALVLLPRRGHAFHTITSNIGRTSAARHASRSGAQAQQQQQQRIRNMITCVGIQTCSKSKVGATGVVSSCVRRASRLAMVAWEAPPNRRDVDRGFSSGRVTDNTVSDRGKGGRGTRRGGGDVWNTDSYSDRGRRSGQEEWDGSRSGRGRGRHDRGFEDSRRTNTDRRQGGRRDGGRGRSFEGKRGPSEGPGRRNGSRDQVRADEKGRRDPVQAWDGDSSQEWDKEGDGSAPASEWMRGALSDVQGELSPNEALEEDTNFDMVYGIAPVLNALCNRRREKLGLYCQDGLAPANKKDRAAANTIYDLARESDVMMTTTDKGYLNSLCGNRPHQGFVLKARPLEFEPILFLPPVQTANPGASATETASVKDVAKDRAPTTAPAPSPIAAGASGNVWLALDEVTDPQNFGALLRSAHFFGAAGVVTCAKNSASLTATVSKASAGAVEVMRVHSTANMMRFLRRSRENGWRVVGTAVSESSVPLRELPVGPNAPPTVVVLGNEGYGVRASVVRECDMLVEVTGEGGGATAEGVEASTLDSLNVSVTGGVVLFHLLAAATATER